MTDDVAITPSLTNMKINPKIDSSDVFRVSLLNNKYRIKFIHLHSDKRSITIAYRVLQFTPGDVDSKVVVTLEMAGCIKSYYPDDLQWSKQAHVQTARARLEKYPMFVTVHVPSYTREEVIEKLFRGKPRMEKLKPRTEENDRIVDKRYVNYAWRCLEKKVRRFLRNGVCDHKGETVPVDIFHNTLSQAEMEEVD